jgi:lipid A 3-O-deacylase
MWLKINRFLRYLGCLTLFGSTMVIGQPGTAAAQIQFAPDVPATLSVWGGAYDFVKNDNPAAEFGLQYRPDMKLWIFQPMVGAMHSTNGATHVFAGISVDVVFFDRLVARPSFAPGYYSRGAGKDLGHPIEFRSAFELAYRFDDSSRLGIEVYHLSNAHLGAKNPGEESLTLMYTLPLSRIF